MNLYSSDFAKYVHTLSIFCPAFHDEALRLVWFFQSEKMDTLSHFLLLLFSYIWYLLLNMASNKIKINLIYVHGAQDKT